MVNARTPKEILTAINDVNSHQEAIAAAQPENVDVGALSQLQQPRGPVACGRKSWRANYGALALQMGNAMQAAVKLDGFTATKVELTIAQKNDLSKWRKCKIPHLIGLPLVILQLSPSGGHTSTSQQPGFYLMAEPNTGLAPQDIQMQVRLVEAYIPCTTATCSATDRASKQ